jgi:hypothetical protein
MKNKKKYQYQLLILLSKTNSFNDTNNLTFPFNCKDIFSAFSLEMFRDKVLPEFPPVFGTRRSPSTA